MSENEPITFVRDGSGKPLTELLAGLTKEGRAKLFAMLAETFCLYCGGDAGGCDHEWSA